MESRHNISVGKGGCMPGKRRMDVTGRRFGHLVAIEPYKQAPSNLEWIWKCQCDCGKTVYVRINNLTSGLRTRCGWGHNKHAVATKIAVSDKQEVRKKENRILAWFKQFVHWMFEPVMLYDNGDTLQPRVKRHYRKRQKFHQKKWTEANRRKAMKSLNDRVSAIMLAMKQFGEHVPFTAEELRHHVLTKTPYPTMFLQWLTYKRDKQYRPYIIFDPKLPRSLDTVSVVFSKDFNWKRHKRQRRKFLTTLHKQGDTVILTPVNPEPAVSQHNAIRMIPIGHPVMYLQKEGKVLDAQFNQGNLTGYRIEMEDHSIVSAPKDQVFPKPQLHVIQ